MTNNVEDENRFRVCRRDPLLPREEIRPLPVPIVFQDEIITLRAEIDRWKGIAIYLADCHAANGSIAHVPTLPDFEKGRIRLIMTLAIQYLNGKLSGPNADSLDISLTNVINRLRVEYRKIPKVAGNMMSHEDP